MLNAVHIIITVIALLLGPESMTSFSVAFNQPSSSNVPFKAQKQADGFWLISDSKTGTLTYFKLQGKELTIKNAKGETASWPISERIDVSNLKKMANDYIVPVLQPKDSPAISILRKDSQIRVTHPGGFLPPLVVSFQSE